MRLPALLFILAAVAIRAQAPDLQAVPLPGSRKDDLALPLILSKADPASAARLNAFLQLVYLEGLAKPGAKDPFSRVRYDADHGDAATGSTSALSWTAARQGRLLGMRMMAEFMGAYPSESTDSLLLDTLHGQPVEAEDLFTPEGLKALGARLAPLRKAKLRQAIQAEKRGKPDGDAQSCIEVQEESLKEQPFDGIAGLQLDGGRIAFPASLDLPHAVLACDVDLTLSLPRQELAPYLSAYGKALLDPGLPAPSLPAAWTRRVFMGRIGTAQVALQLQREADGSIRGSYAYLKRGAAIELSGKAQSGAYALDESDENGDTTGRLAFRQEGLQLKGEWTSPDGKRSLPFTASPE